SASSPVFALYGSSSRDREQVLRLVSARQQKIHSLPPQMQSRLSGLHIKSLNMKGFPVWYGLCCSPGESVTLGATHDSVTISRSARAGQFGASAPGTDHPQ